MPDPTPTLTEIAATVREHSPGALPPHFRERPDYGFIQHSVLHCKIDDDIARHVLIAAMVMDAEIDRPGTRWESFNPDGKSKTFPDGREPSLLSCYAAWKWARGIA